MRDWLDRKRAEWRKNLPTAEALSRHRWLRPVAHRLTDHDLWHMGADSVARGAAIGLFWAFAVPVGQILFAVVHCVWWRGNIPVAAAITFVTNPLTLGFWLWLAYQVGSMIVAPGSAPIELIDLGWLQRLRALGWPTFVGMSIFAVGGSLMGYLSVLAGARLWFHWRYVRRIRRRKAPPRNPGPD